MEKKNRARLEYIVLTIFLGILLIGLYPALKYSRAETRDGIRREEIAQFKILLEQEFNKLGEYPVNFDASPHEYVYSDDGWYLRAELENIHDEQEAYDAEAGRNYYYRVRNEDGKSFYEVCGGSPGCEL